MAAFIDRLGLEHCIDTDNVPASTRHASELTWHDLGYTSVSVDRPGILEQDTAPWRLKDKPPVES